MNQKTNGLSFSAHIRASRTKYKGRRGRHEVGKGSLVRTVHKTTVPEKYSIDLLISVPYTEGFWGPTL